MRLDDYSLTELQNAVNRKLGDNPIEEFLKLFSEPTQKYVARYMFYPHQSGKYRNDDFASGLEWFIKKIDNLANDIHSAEGRPSDTLEIEESKDILKELLRVLGESYSNYQIALKALEYHQFNFLKTLKANYKL